MGIEQITQFVENRFDKYIDFLCDICAFETRATDKKTIDRMVDYIAVFSKKRRISGKANADGSLR